MAAPDALSGSASWVRKIVFSTTPSTPAGYTEQLERRSPFESLHESAQEVRQKSDVSDDEEEVYPGKYDQRADPFLPALVYDIHESAHRECEPEREDTRASMCCLGVRAGE